MLTPSFPQRDITSTIPPSAVCAAALTFAASAVMPEWLPLVGEFRGEQPVAPSSWQQQPAGGLLALERLSSSSRRPPCTSRVPMKPSSSIHADTVNGFEVSISGAP